MSLPKPYYSEPGITIYHGDCRDILPHLEPVDLVLTDPPWNMDYFKDDNKSWEEYCEWLKYIKNISESKSYGQIWFLSTKSIPHISHLFKDYQCFASVKNFSQMTPKKLPNCWDIAFIRADKYLGNGRNWFLSNTAGMLGERTDHPTPRALDVTSYIISLYEYQTILDPFMGSGTTLRACKDLGRRGIGIEIEEKYCEIAVKRLQQEVFDFKSPSEASHES